MADSMSLPDDPFDELLSDRDDTVRRLVQYVEDYEDATTRARDLAERDRDFYDGLQWTPEEIEDLEARRQPPVVYNRIAPKVNTMRGTEVRTRTDPVGMPRTPMHSDGAEAVTDALRFVSDQNDFPCIRGQLFDNLALEGAGGCIVDHDEDGDDIKVCIRHIPWDRLIYDPHSRRPDFRDGKYIGVLTWFNVEDAIEEYASRYEGEERKRVEKLIRLSTDTGFAENSDTLDDRPRKSWFDKKRNRLRVVELYYRDTDDNGRLVWHVAHFSWAGFVVEPKVVAYTDPKGRPQCPIVATSAFVNRENERYGIVRHLIDPQKEVNKRRSKALHYLNVAQVVMEEGAADVEDVRAQIARPDGVIVLRDREALFDIQRNLDLATTHFQFMQEAKAEIDSIGPDQAIQSASQRAMSGVAIQRQQQLGTMQLEPVFDHLRNWQKRVFEQVWYRIRQFWTYEKWMRLRDSERKEGYRFVALNRPMTRLERMQELAQEGMPIEETFGATGWPQGLQLYMQAAQQIQQQAQAAQQAGVQVSPQQMQQMALQMVAQAPQAQERFTQNDISQLEVDIIIDETPDTSVIAEDQLQALARLAENGLGQLIPPEMIIESMPHLRDKKKFYELIEQSKQPNQAAQQAQQVQMQQLVAELEKTKAEAQEKLARAQQLMAEVGQTMPAEAAKTQAEAFKTAAEAGTTLGRLDVELQRPAEPGMDQTPTR